MYSIITLHSSLSEERLPRTEELKGCSRFHGALLADGILAISLIAIAILTIISVTTHAQTLRCFSPLYPVGVFSFLGVSLAVCVVDLNVFLFKRAVESQQISKEYTPSVPSPVPASVPVAGEDEPFSALAQDPLVVVHPSGLHVEQHHVDPISSALPDSPQVQIAASEGPAPPVSQNWHIILTRNDSDQDLLALAKKECTAQLELLLATYRAEMRSEDSVENLIQWFDQKLNSEHHASLRRHLLDFLGGYFDVNTVDLHQAVFDSHSNITHQTIAACLELLKIISVREERRAQSHCAQLENALKKIIYKKYALDETTTPIGFEDWSEIPLRKILILSDKNFYFLDSDSCDYRFLYEAFEEKGTRLNPKKSQYSEEDYRLYMEKKQRLNLTDKPVIPANVRLNEDVPPYDTIKRLAIALADLSPGDDYGVAMIPFLDDYQHPVIQQLRLPNMHFQHLYEVDLSGLNIHIFAVYLWNALRAAHFDTGEPPLSLIRIADNHHIPLSAAVPISSHEDSPPYDSLRNLALALVDVDPDGDFSAVMIPYLEAFNHPAIQQLCLPDIGNRRLGEVNLYGHNMHIFAVYLWKALKVARYDTGAPSPALIYKASYHRIHLI